MLLRSFESAFVNPSVPVPIAFDKPLHHKIMYSCSHLLMPSQNHLQPDAQVIALAEGGFVGEAVVAVAVLPDVMQVQF